MMSKWAELVVAGIIGFAAGHWFGYWYGRWTVLVEKRPEAEQAGEK